MHLIQRAAGPDTPSNNACSNETTALMLPSEARQAPGASAATAYSSTLDSPSLGEDVAHRECEGDDFVRTKTMATQEALQLTSSSIPVVLTYLLQYSFSFVNLLVLGHIGADELSAAALANMTLVVVVFSPCIGLASALDTYCSTAYTASTDKTLVGFHLQRGIIAVTGHFLLISPALWCLDSILIWAKQDLVVSHLCGQFMRVQILGVLAWMYFECIKRFLQAQGIMQASTYILLVTMPIHLLNNYLLVWSPVVGFGFLGAAVANVLTYWIMFVGIVAYTRYSRAREHWGGLSMQSLWAMPQYYRLAVPSTVMICAEYWILDLLALAASYSGNAALAAQSILISTCTLTYQFADGLSVAVCNHVGNLIGQGRARRAKVSAYVGIVLAAILGTATLVLALVVGEAWGRIYSNDSSVIAIVAALMPACALFQMADAVNSVASGVLRSLGRQTAGAHINFVSYYLIGLPLCLFMTYGKPNVGVAGLWYGICAGVTLAVAMQFRILCCRTDWDEEVVKCVQQVSKDQLDHHNQQIKSPSSHSLSSSTS